MDILGDSEDSQNDRDRNGVRDMIRLLVRLLTLSSPLQRSTGRWHRVYKTFFPWANISFELLLLAYNVAYLFEQIGRAHV